MKKDLSKIAELILEADVAYLITVSGDDTTATVITDDMSMDVEDEICEALFDCWEQESTQPDGEPCPIGKFLFEYDPENEPCMCESCQEIAKQEIILSQQN
jgi:hypothetical protein